MKTLLLRRRQGRGGGRTIQPVPAETETTANVTRTNIRTINNRKNMYYEKAYNTTTTTTSSTAKREREQQRGGFWEREKEGKKGMQKAVSSESCR